MNTEIENILKKIDEKVFALTIVVQGMENFYEVLDNVQLYLRNKGLDARYYDDSDGKKLVAIEKLHSGIRNEK